MAEGRGYRGDDTTGFQSPAQDYVEPAVDLHALLDLRRPSRFAVRVIGQALAERGICQGDILVVDTATPPRCGQAVIATVSGENLLCRLRQVAAGWVLRPSRGRAVLIEGDDVAVWAVVHSLVRKDL